MWFLVFDFGVYLWGLIPPSLIAGSAITTSVIAHHFIAGVTAGTVIAVSGIAGSVIARHFIAGSIAAGSVIAPAATGASNASA
eukprot:905369-Rhodomonas_salina.1